MQSIDVYKVHLDKFRAQQEVMFDWTADLTGTGDRSEYTVESNQIIVAIISSVIWIYRGTKCLHPFISIADC